MKRKAAKPRPEPRSADGTHSVLPMEIQVGDRLTDAGFEWEVVSHPAALHGGKSLRARIRLRSTRDRAGHDLGGARAGDDPAGREAVTELRLRPKLSGG